MIKKIVIRFLLLLLIFSVLNFIYSATLFDDDMKKVNEQIVEMQQAQETTDVFYFAESSNASAQETDSIKLSISEITNLFFPSLKITAINKPAAHASMFKCWLKQIDLKKKIPRAIVVTLNMRTFDAACRNAPLENKLQIPLILTYPFPKLANRFMLSLQGFYTKTEKQREQDVFDEWRTTKLKFPFEFKYKTTMEWNDAMSKGGYLNADGSWDMKKIELACHYIKGYAFNIDEENPRIKDFDEMVEWCEKQKIPLYLNLLAENVQYADSLVGKELVFLMRANRDYLVKRYHKNNCKVIDNLECVSGQEYTEQNWTTEHYSYRGRMIIAKNLADTLKVQFNNEYKKIY